MKYDKVFRLRLTEDQQKELEEQARERGLSSKADRIRQALGWPLADSPQGPAASPADLPASPDPTPSSGDPVQRLADRLKGP